MLCYSGESEGCEICYAESIGRFGLPQVGAHAPKAQDSKTNALLQPIGGGYGDGY